MNKLANALAASTIAIASASHGASFPVNGHAELAKTKAAHANLAFFDREMSPFMKDLLVKEARRDVEKGNIIGADRLLLSIMRNSKDKREADSARAAALHLHAGYKVNRDAEAELFLLFALLLQGSNSITVRK